MKIYVDTAIVDEIRQVWELGILDGVTTNPSLILKSGRNLTDALKEISQIVDDCISGEVISLDYQGMVKEALELMKISKKIVIKIPMTKDGLKAVKELTAQGIRTNVTLVFSANQALLAAKAGATYVSPFLGRLDDVGEDSMQLIHDIKQIYQNYQFPTQIICASIRSPLHVLKCAKAGADIATVPYKIIMDMFNHPLTNVGIDRFLQDYEKSKK
ncbi:MAG TPA: fructose-6-phosphate aldolase [Bacilli bacterium]|nr:MAG: Transaldolase [Tenericutes bacterium ADurb.BinA124]HPN61615.1 fructose-6-phosphate aldolase [Bacilli bacterium]HPX84483.1 fructose-6-phosphate aldolase [Bacilli bacterium]HQC74359.1 fructose-6-phosphate aldolase [Bacilli bacterium]